MVELAAEGIADGRELGIVDTIMDLERIEEEVIEFFDAGWAVIPNEGFEDGCGGTIVAHFLGNGGAAACEFVAFGASGADGLFRPMVGLLGENGFVEVIDATGDEG